MSTIAASHVVEGEGSAEEIAYTTVHRVVFPVDNDPDLQSLYVDLSRGPAVVPQGAGDHPVQLMAASDASIMFEDRRALELGAGERVSLATYFNAFPASYWRRWTDVTSVRLQLELDAPARVAVYKSNSRGESQRVDFVRGESGVLTFDLPLTSFGDGGWYWFDLHATDGDTRMTWAEWSVPSAHARAHGTASIGITTFNRPDYCVAQLQKLGEDESLREVIDRVYVVDQGNQLVTQDPGYASASAGLGDRLRVIRQGNLGGSGGFSRGMAETIAAGDSEYVLLLDDDVVSEPEGIRRSVEFANFCRTATIVGGHMFSMYAKQVLHSFGERVNQYRFFWGSAPQVQPSHDFSTGTLRSTPWLHQRIDVDYNGWWMCLIPVQALQEIGLSLPLFIKWDDAEYGLRAKEHGFPVVSFPGAAVWHVPWTDKDDAVDWQAYYHQRNRWVAALLHSPYRNGGSLPQESFAADVKHLLSLQYSAVELRLKALEDILSGADHLHDDLGSGLATVRSMRSHHTDARVSKEPSDFPEPRRNRPLRKGKDPERPSNPIAFGLSAVAGALRQVRPVRERAKAVPEERVATLAAKWWRLSHLDSAIVTSADGAGASMYVRDPELFRSYLVRSLRLHRQLLARWSRLSADYQRAQTELTSVEAWRRTFETNAVDERA